MGLAPYGEPRFARRRCARIVARRPRRAATRSTPTYFDFLARPADVLRARWPSRFGGPPRAAGVGARRRFTTTWRAARRSRLEEILLEKVRYLHERVRLARTCAWRAASRSTAWQRPHPARGAVRAPVRPARGGRRGGCLGAAALAQRALTGDGGRSRRARCEHVYWGPRFTSDAVAEQLAALERRRARLPGPRGARCWRPTVDRLAAGRGRRLVPRRHGVRSARARRAQHPGRSARSRRCATALNRLVKHREAFRPFAPSVLPSPRRRALRARPPLAVHAGDLPVSRSPLALPAITHVDGSARPQTVDAAATRRATRRLLEARSHRRTGCPAARSTPRSTSATSRSCARRPTRSPVWPEPRSIASSSRTS